jgi:hypothetical protein
VWRTKSDWRQARRRPQQQAPLQGAWQAPSYPNHGPRRTVPHDDRCPVGASAGKAHEVWRWVRHAQCHPAKLDGRWLPGEYRRLLLRQPRARRTSGSGPALQCAPPSVLRKMSPSTLAQTTPDPVSSNVAPPDAAATAGGDGLTNSCAPKPAADATMAATSNQVTQRTLERSHKRATGRCARPQSGRLWGLVG